MTSYPDSRFDHVLLGNEQKRLLEDFVEASRRVAREARQKFIVANTMNGTYVHHQGLPNDYRAFEGDLETLAREGMLASSYGPSGNALYDVTPLGYSYYEHIKLTNGTPLTRVEETVRTFIDGERFRRSFPGAFRKWQEAEAMLWGSDSHAGSTTMDLTRRFQGIIATP